MFEDEEASHTPIAAPPPIPNNKASQKTLNTLDDEDSEDDGETRDWGSRDDFRTNPAQEVHPKIQAVPEPSPAATLPMMPTAPVAARALTAPINLPPPRAGANAPTLMAIAPAATFAPPQTYPVTQPRPAPVVMDVTPRSLGIATVSGFCEELIRRNSRLPAEMIKMFTTSRDQQNAVRIVVCQGESRRLDNNVVIGDLRLEGLPARPRGETSIEVTFSLDASGILQVRARDSQTGREQRASLDLVGGVREQDVGAARDRIQQLRR